MGVYKPLAVRGLGPAVFCVDFTIKPVPKITRPVHGGSGPRRQSDDDGQHLLGRMFQISLEN